MHSIKNLFLAVLAVAILAGCPLPPTTPIIPIDDPVVVVPPVVTVPEMGKVIASGKFYDPANKGSVHDDGDLLKRQIAFLNFYFYPESGESPSSAQSFRIPVESGSYYGEMAVRPGSYNVWVEAIDIFGQVLFYKNTNFEVVTGNNRIQVELSMITEFCNKFIFPDLAGDFGDYGQAEIKVKSGQTFWAIYEAKYLFGWENPPILYFTVLLPLAFDGDKDQAVLTIWDLSGAPHLTELNFDLLEAVGGMMYLPFVYPQWMGNVDVDITFEYENEHFVYSGGQFWNSIKEAADNSSSSEITIGTGDYEGCNTNHSISITGQGASMTRIVDFNTKNANVICVSPWAKGGGAQIVVQLSNLEIVNGPGKSNAIYSDAAVVVEAGVLRAKNCVFRSSNSGVVVNYASSLDIDHCVFFGDKNPISRAVAAYNEGTGTVVQNSIFLDYDIALHCSNAVMVFEYDLFFGCNQPISDDVPGSNYYSTPGNIWEADPLLQSDYHLGSGSPGLGKAKDDLDIGIVF